MKKLLFVYNPCSGKGQIKNHLSTVVEILSDGPYEVTIYPTKSALDACRLVEERASDFDLLVCSGGDGTLDEVVTGLMRCGEKRTVGYIPAGSTNDFANSLGIPKQMDAAARLILEGEPFACDIGKFNDSYFVYVAAFGMLTDVSWQTRQDLKNALGHAAYVLEGMKRMGTWKSSHIQIESDACSESGEFVFGMITNSNSVGGIKGLSGRDVELNDGMFEVMLVRTPKNLIEWQEAITSVLFQDQESRMVLRFKAHRLAVISDEPVSWTRDGENGGEHTRVELENMRQALEILTASPAEPVPHSVPLTL